MSTTPPDPILDIRGLEKTYRNGPTALGGVDLQIRKGEIFALLGPNGAGKTTLIGSVCGLVNPTGGSIQAFGLDIRKHWREVRCRIGLVPQELSFDMFDKVIRQVRYSRGMFGCAPDEARIEEVLKALSLWDKRDEPIRKLSGGMKRRVMIAKALAHDPDLLFLDEPTAGVDVELRRDMWKQIEGLRERGTTIILTTHYIEEAEEMADRVGVINKGRILLTDDKDAIMAQLGRTEAVFELAEPMGEIPAALSEYPVTLEDEGRKLVYRGGDGTGTGKREVAELAQDLTRSGIAFTGLDAHESSLEEIFVGLVEQGKEEIAA
ncbi:ABC transporter ATP-binding protein [Alteraurantiacibacter aquimixticola]|uniref:ABC transporter ATP-binding protein n=1 Tax=Alteraurantiacibacter aquimixticola TaxID=2489173 RepID=A0A4T3F0U8_9SPHN|nr:ABC transporter ATP-binding protein [Alteraurantiacibacter aquimixticola]TIX50167.1 ABC transporter ATP-binding protein [Alteraurantiacibacter aquimixticola]